MWHHTCQCPGGRVFKIVGAAITKQKEKNENVETRGTDSKLESDEHRVQDGT